MKRILLAALAMSILTAPATAAAQPAKPSNDFAELLGLKITEHPTPPKPKPPIKQPKLQPVVYAVAEGDNLTKIGSVYNIEWQRLWAKNTQLAQPDLINIGDQITIPEPSEQLSREIPAQVSLPEQTPGVEPLRSFDGDNTYDYGYCTWYVKNRRGASIPNSLGNANTWYSRAVDAGMAVGSTPRVGAVGTTSRGLEGHVVYVESVNDDGSINISEMNSPTRGKATYRTASADEFQYIY